MDLDISYGYTEDPQGGSFILLFQTGTVNLTRLTLRHMHAKSAIGGAIQGKALSGSMTNVVMANCTEGSGGGPGGLYLQVATFRFTDVTFIDCLSAGSAERQGIAIVGLGSMPWNATFAGQVSFISSYGLFSQGSQAYFQTSPSINGSILSEPTKPANWIFTSLPQSCIQIYSASFLKFQANSVSTFGIKPPALQPSSYLLIVSGTSVEIEVQDYIRASHMGIASLAASDTVLVATELTSINSIAEVALRVLGNYTTIHATSIQIDGFQKTALGVETSAQFNLQASSLTIARSPSVQYPAPAVYVYGDASMFIGSLFNVSGSNVSSELGGAIFFSGRSLSITAGLRMLFGYNYASYGGAIYVQSGNLTLVANHIDFSYNSAQFGGAIAVVNVSAFSMSGRVRYESNQAEYGGAIYTKAVLASSFRAAEFSSNHATLEGCLIHFLDTCTSFVPTGTTTGNRAANLSGNSCKDNTPMCVDPIPSSNSDTCSGLPPSIGSWECSNGQWTSVGSVSGDSVLIPSGSQTLVITGNLTVSGDVTFTGLGSTIVIEGGCASIDGSLQIELSEEDLEQISKESGSSRAVQLISQSANCSSLQSLVINAFKGEKSCRKIESASSREDNDGSTSSLLAVFKVSSSGCNTKWIILGSVLGGVLLLVVIIILLVTFNPRMKAFVRPFWGRARMDARNKLAN
jgi:predicted outer membrane repeat protein